MSKNYLLTNIQYKESLYTKIVPKTELLTLIGLAFKVLFAYVATANCK